LPEFSFVMQILDSSRTDLALPSVQALSLAIIDGKSAGDAIADLYAPSPHDSHAWASLMGLLPDRQDDCLALARQGSAEPLCTLVVLLASLKTVRGDCSRLHFEMANILDARLREGVSQARYPCLIHCFLMLDQFSGAPHQRAFAQAVIARELESLAPRDAAAHAVQAHAYGSQPALKLIRKAAARYEGIEARDLVDVLSGVHSLSRVLDLPALHNHVLCAAAEADPDPAQVIALETRQFPSVRGDSQHYVFRDAGRRLVVPGVRVHSFAMGTISIDVSIPGMTQFYVFDSQDRCISDLSHGITPFIASDCIQADGNLAVLDDRFSGSMSVCHFLLDRLTRMPLYERATKGAPLRFLMADGFSYYRAVIAKLGLTDSFLVPERRRFSVRAGRLLVSSNIKSPFPHPAHKGARWAVDYLRRAFEIADDQALTRRLFISRRDSTAGRGILNEEAVETLLHDRGFEMVTLTGMPLEDQLRLFAEASHLVGVHGAGLTNMLFASRHCKVLEILPALAATPAYWLLSCGTGQDYRAMIARDPALPQPDYGSWVHDHRYAERDVLVPVDRLAEMLDAMGCTADRP